MLKLLVARLPWLVLLLCLTWPPSLEAQPQQLLVPQPEHPQQATVLARHSLILWNMNMGQWLVYLERQGDSSSGAENHDAETSNGRHFLVFQHIAALSTTTTATDAASASATPGQQQQQLRSNNNNQQQQPRMHRIPLEGEDLEQALLPENDLFHHNDDDADGSPAPPQERDPRVVLALQMAQDHHILSATEVAAIRRRRLERAVLIRLYYGVLANETARLSLTTPETGNWLLPSADACTWVGVSCGPLPAKALPGPLFQPSKTAGEVKILEPLPADAVTAIQLPSLGLAGTIPGVLGHLKYLYKLRLDRNRLHGTLPALLANATALRYVDVSHNKLEGSLPAAYGTALPSLQYFSVQRNYLTGTLPSSSAENLGAWANTMHFLDLSENNFRGTIPSHFGSFSNLKTLLLDDNLFTGELPKNLGDMTTKLTYLDVACNSLTGSIPSSLQGSVALQQMIVGANLLNGTFPTELLNIKSLQSLILSDNYFQGTLPNTYEWGRLTALGVLYLHDNEFSGSLPPKMFPYGKRQLRLMDLSRNRFEGTIPTEVGLMTGLHLIHAESNRLSGTLPKEMVKLHKNLRLNFTDNLITGEIPALFCGQGSSTLSLLYHDFGCDAVLCPAGTFNRFGHATLHSGCRECPNVPPGQENVLGRTSCEGLTNVYGDLDSDGIVSQREVLRLLFIVTIGRFWGQKYQSWALMDKNECDLEGVVCVRGAVAKIDLTDAQLCSTGDKQAGNADFCLGLPSEIGLLTALEILQLSRQRYLRGSIPTEIGQLTRLRHFDVASNTFMTGTIPTEVGRLSGLVHFLVSFCKFAGSMPSDLFSLTRLEKLHLTDNDLTGTIPDEIHLSSLKELMMSRNSITGSLPTSIGHMTKLENFEVYGNQLTGTLPTEFGSCSNLKRIDIFNNHLTGTIPVELASLPALQILHGKMNDITGTIPPEFGSLSELSWIDFSGNYLHGTIPESLGSSTSIRDFRVADNMLHDPVPRPLCLKDELNGGATGRCGCDGVICPLGTYSESGFATEAEGRCIPCPTGEATVYLGSTSCRTFDDKDLLSIIHAVMEGVQWPADYGATWNKEDQESDVCDWHGVECDADGEISSLTIPVPFDDYS